MATSIKSTTKKRAAGKRSAQSSMKPARSQAAAPKRKARGAHAALGKTATKKRTPNTAREKPTHDASSRDVLKRMISTLTTSGRNLLARITPESWQA